MQRPRVQPWLPLLALLGAFLAVPPRAALAGASAAGAPAGDSSSASAATPEALVGEDRAVPTALPTPEADEAGPSAVTRTQQVAPSFALPAFVITGGGERQALAQRGDMGAALDTSGGIKTSPGEAGAGKDQRATEAQRATPQDETYTAKPRYGDLSAAWGIGQAYALDGLLAGEQGAWYGWLEGGAHGDNGGPRTDGALAPALRNDERVEGLSGWRPGPDALLELSADGEWRALRLALAPGGGWMQRSRGGAALALEGVWQGATLRVQAHGGDALLLLPAAGYAEDRIGAELTAVKNFNGRTGSALLEAGLDADRVDQRPAQGGRSLTLGKAWLESRFEPWTGARLGLGLQGDLASGGASAYQLGPRADFEQRLLRSLGLRLGFGTGLGLSSLDGEAFRQDPLLPNPGLKPSRRVADGKAALLWQPLEELSVEAGAFVRQDEDAYLPDDPSRNGLWTDTAVGILLVRGLSVGERLARGPWWQQADGLWQSGALPDLGATPTFLPPWKASIAVGFKSGPWSAELRLKGQGPRQALLAGGWSVPAQWDAQARVAWAWSDGLSLFVEADSLSGAAADWPGYTPPTPGADAGVKLSF